VFQDLNLTIAPKEKVGIVGPSGAGKSTLFKLIQRQFDPQSGSVFIDGQDLRHVSAQSIARAITEVPQEPALFHRSLKENILYGNPGASPQQLDFATKQARCEDFISARPEGILAVVGERGLRLSGGERQRIALARAFLKNSQIVLLDEATSSIDYENEALIQTALAKICANRTVLVIAHRLSTVQAMDRILVLNQGKIIDSGDHFALLGRCNLYASLWEHQGKPKSQGRQKATN
jgi:ATP-binding cassette subfamily B protein